MTDNLTIQVLKEIRDEVRTTRKDLSERLDQTNARLDQSNDRLESLEGTVTELVGAVGELAEQQRFVVRWLKAGSRRDHQIEKRMGALETRVTSLEARDSEK